MKFRLLSFTCLVLSAALYGQSGAPLIFHDIRDPQSSGRVTLYQLTHKPNKKTKRLFEKAVRLMKKQEYQQAEECLEDAAKLDSHDWAINNNLGVVYMKLGKLDAARELLQHNVELDPQNALGRLNLAVCHFNGRNYPLATKLARESLRLDPRLAEAQYLLGLSEVAQGHWSGEARKMLEQGHGSASVDDLLKRWPQGDLRASKVESGALEHP